MDVLDAVDVADYQEQKSIQVTKRFAFPYKCVLLLCFRLNLQNIIKF